MRFTYEARNKAQKCWLNVILSSKTGIKDAWPSPTLVLGVLLTCASRLWPGWEQWCPHRPPMTIQIKNNGKEMEKNGNSDFESTFTFDGFFSNTWTYLAASDWHMYPKFQSLQGPSTARTKSKSQEESSRDGTVAVTFSARRGDRAKCDRCGSSPGRQLAFPCPFGWKSLHPQNEQEWNPRTVGLSTCWIFFWVALWCTHHSLSYAEGTRQDGKQSQCCSLFSLRWHHTVRVPMIWGFSSFRSTHRPAVFVPQYLTTCETPSSCWETWNQEIGVFISFSHCSGISQTSVSFCSSISHWASKDNHVVWVIAIVGQSDVRKAKWPTNQILIGSSWTCGETCASLPCFLKASMIEQSTSGHGSYVIYIWQFPLWCRCWQVDSVVLAH